MTFNLGGNSAYHRDVHDHPEAFSMTSILWKPTEEVHGDEGLIVLPEYRIAVQLRDRDCYLLKVNNRCTFVLSKKSQEK
jgi:hypothetical protein